MTTNAATDQKPMHTVTGVTPYLLVRDARAAAELYQRAFGAEVIAMMPLESSDKIIHCHLRINSGPLFLCDPFPEHGHPLEKPQSFTLHLQVDDAQAWWDRAVNAGCESTMPVTLQFWGDNYGQVRDPFGIEWSFGSAPR